MNELEKEAVRVAIVDLFNLHKRTLEAIAEMALDISNALSIIEKRLDNLEHYD